MYVLCNRPNQSIKWHSIIHIYIVITADGFYLGARPREVFANVLWYSSFGRDFSGKTKTDVIQTIRSYQNAAEIPLFIGVDEEGGTVNRISKNPGWCPGRTNLACA